MIKNKILLTVLFAFTANLFIQTSFPMQKNTSKPKATTKSINLAPKKSTLNAVLKRQLILKALTKDESSDGALEQISYLIISIILGGATTAAFNYQQIDIIVRCFIDHYKNKQPNGFWESLFKREISDFTPDIIKIGATFTLSSLGYYIVLNVLFHYMNKKDNSEENILRLMAILDQLDN